MRLLQMQLLDQESVAAEALRSSASAEARERVARDLHDSVLQTLTLIQKHAEDPQRVQQLARAEERELRDWLYGEPQTSASVKAALTGSTTMNRLAALHA